MTAFRSIRRTTVVAGALALVLASSTTAQRSSKAFRRFADPLEPVALDLASGTITRGPSVRDRAAATTVDFYNNDLSGFVGLDTGGGACEWFDAGVKGSFGNASDRMNAIVFPYCTSKPSPELGGRAGR